MNKIKNKIISLLLTAMLILGTVGNAFAATGYSYSLSFSSTKTTYTYCMKSRNSADNNNYYLGIMNYMTYTSRGSAIKYTRTDKVYTETKSYEVALLTKFSGAVSDGRTYYTAGSKFYASTTGGSGNIINETSRKTTITQTLR